MQDHLWESCGSVVSPYDLCRSLICLHRLAGSSAFSSGREDLLCRRLVLVSCHLCDVITWWEQKLSALKIVVLSGDQDKSWAPHVVCSVCVEERRQWFKVQGFNLKNRKDISCPTIIRSAIRPVLHLPIPSPPDTLDNILNNLDQISHISRDNDDGYDPGTNDPEPFSQSDLNDLV
ncbi:uncharacterized protein TNCV_390891 [Trichonephila clavipes]|nr:uncharacterized protein TNCV_390891 [Trichonephila clavipes]